ncbi:uncharacterized protein GIQ15_03430 [Arthroderma uncinatum]|uniref:uncharacterized protein n=1 Tax=Arthroderma uncinatum TaxID=74035 RepID=UPI00144AC585|nr:uncharacterized protein GIQ15_03430 [Arthroderma uncinatum]KAF3484106.1 hypothetical protein GIQ15_03430 [Arthroderma uncinatum]
MNATKYARSMLDPSWNPIHTQDQLSSNQLLDMMRTVVEPFFPDRVNLQVGEASFTTTVKTLTARSNYFQDVFSSQTATEIEDDGSVFVDGNGAVFAYVMEYLRRGVFPLAYDHAKGHDYGLYARILEEARYFKCTNLVLWLEGECYNKCVVKRVETEMQDSEWPRISMEGFVDFTVKSYAVEKDGAYVCPRNIPGHLSAGMCGAKCLKKTANRAGQDYTWMIAKTKCVFNRGWMTDSGSSFLKFVEETKANVSRGSNSRVQSPVKVNAAPKPSTAPKPTTAPKPSIAPAPSTAPTPSSKNNAMNTKTILVGSVPVRWG